MIHFAGERTNKSRAAAHKRNQAGVSMLRDGPQQFDPLVENLRQRPQDLTAGNQNLNGRTAAALEKPDGVVQQLQGSSGLELRERRRERGPGVCRDTAGASSKL